MPHRIALLALLLLAGCWSRPGPLVTPAEAVQPVPGGVYEDFAVTARADKSYDIAMAKPENAAFEPMNCLAKPLEDSFYILQCAQADAKEYAFLIGRVTKDGGVALYGAGDDTYSAWLADSHSDIEPPSDGEMIKLHKLNGSLAEDTAILAGYARHLAAHPHPDEKIMMRSAE